MTIRYTANLTFEEQIVQWENGNSEEAKLGTWLRHRLIEIEDQQIQDIAAIVEQAEEEAYDKGRDQGYADGVRSGEYGGI